MRTAAVFLVKNPDEPASKVVALGHMYLSSITGTPVAVADALGHAK
jgi:hypothetical protein